MYWNATSKFAAVCALLAGFLLATGCPKPAGEKTAQEGGSKKGGGGPTPVTVVPAIRRDVPVFLSGLGNIAAFNTVTVRSRVDGELIKVNYTEGQEVKKGDLLAEIDPRPFEVQLAQARGAMAKDQAQLTDARANLSRYQALFKENVVAKQQLDSIQATVGQFEGTLESDRAQIANAQLQLTYAKVVAPESGRVGLRLVDQGNVVRANDLNGLATISQLQPISVIFTLPADNLPQVMNRMKAGQKVRFELFSRDDSVKLGTGELVTIDNSIDAQTGTFKLKGSSPNEDRSLWPNQFVNVRLLVDVRRGAVTVPAVALQRGNRGTFVYTVKGDNTAEMRNVKIDMMQGDLAVVEEGVNPGDRVVVDGLERLTAGAKVDPRERQRPSGGGAGARPVPPAKPHPAGSE